MTTVGQWQFRVYLFTFGAVAEQLAYWFIPANNWYDHPFNGSITLGFVVAAIVCFINWRKTRVSETKRE